MTHIKDYKTVAESMAHQDKCLNNESSFVCCSALVRYYLLWMTYRCFAVCQPFGHLPATVVLALSPDTGHQEFAEAFRNEHTYAGIHDGCMMQ